MMFQIPWPTILNRQEELQMNESLSTFMVVAATVVIIILLIFGIAFNALTGENEHHHYNMRYEHQIQFK